MTDFEDRFPDYDVLAKWESPSWNEQTREVIAKRLQEVPPRLFFTELEWITAMAIADRVLPQPDRPKEPIPIIPFLDAALHRGEGKGYRYEDLPPRPEAWRRGIAAIDDEATMRFDQPFAAITAERQDEVLRLIQKGDVISDLWRDLPAEKFFVKVLLEDIVDYYYSHPFAWNEIGFGGPASPRGYVRLGLNQRDPWEAGER